MNIITTDWVCSRVFSPSSTATKALDRLKMLHNSSSYRPFRGSNIRVVRFKPSSSSSNNDKIEGKLLHIHIDGSDFNALSYVWESSR